MLSSFSFAFFLSFFLSACLPAAGGLVTLRVTLTAHHWGHMEVRACPNGRDSTQSCLDANPLEFVRDLRYSMPADPNYPERGYFKFPGPDYEMQFRLPSNLEGSEVLLQVSFGFRPDAQLSLEQRRCVQ